MNWRILILIGSLLLTGCQAPAQSSGAGLDEDMQQLADVGGAHVKHNTAVLFETKDDFAKAATWHCKAATMGNRASQTRLGEFYRHGVGVPMDRVQSYMWYSLAASQSDDPHPIYSLKFLTKRMTAAQISDAKKLVREFKPRKYQPYPIMQFPECETLSQPRLPG
jgi:TPR repeat protein